MDEETRTEIETLGEVLKALAGTVVTNASVSKDASTLIRNLSRQMEVAVEYLAGALERLSKLEERVAALEQTTE